MEMYMFALSLMNIILLKLTQGRGEV